LYLADIEEKIDLGKFSYNTYKKLQLSLHLDLPPKPKSENRQKRLKWRKLEKNVFFVQNWPFSLFDFGANLNQNTTCVLEMVEC
jgi:hypothetical protein